jgi:hypothetical protein
MKKVLGQIVGVSLNLGETEEAVEPCVDLLEGAALGLAETKDWISQVESDVAGLWTAMADGCARTEEIQ